MLQRKSVHCRISSADHSIRSRTHCHCTTGSRLGRLSGASYSEDGAILGWSDIPWRLCNSGYFFNRVFLFPVEHGISGTSRSSPITEEDDQKSFPRISPTVRMDSLT